MKKTIVKSLLVLTLSLIGYVGQTHAATFYIWPNSKTFAPGATNTVYVGIDTQGQASNAADMVLTYNPNQIEVLGVGAGSAYESYLAPVIGGGTARLTAYSVGGNLNGKATFASVSFKSKPGVTNASMGFMFSPGSTTDSNIANLNSSDILSGVGSANFTFSAPTSTTTTTTTTETTLRPAAPEEPEKPKDETAPEVILSEEEIENYDGEINFAIRDDESGVLLQTLRVTVSENSYDENSDFIRLMEAENGFEVTLRPGNFEPGQEVPVKIELRDQEGNWMEPVEFSYLIPEIEDEVLVEEPTDCPELKPAAPTQIQLISDRGLIIAIILLILTLLIAYRKRLTEWLKQSLRH